MYLIFKYNAKAEQRVAKGFDSECGRLCATAKTDEDLDKYFLENKSKLTSDEEFFVVEAIKFDSPKPYIQKED
jgi:hypothetical protein